MIQDLIWLIPALPLMGFLINGLGNKKIPHPVSGWIATSAMLASFIISLMVFFQLRSSESDSILINYFQWIKAGNFTAQFGFLADRLSVIMIGVDLNVMLPLIGHVFVAIDRFDWTGRLAGAAINTLVRMDEKLL